MRIGFAAGLTLVALFSPTGAGAEPPRLHLAHERFQLGNGLTVIVHEDHSAPVITFAVHYHVGSKDEPPGRSGFAHLFEHLMFGGSQNSRGEWFAPMQAIGATGVNGTTEYDSTYYYETFPTPALEPVLWLESDRMGHLLPAIDQARLDQQRGVVQNEKRQGDNQPYARLPDRLYAGLFPADHPYHHLTIGSMEDLDAASLDDVRAWFRAYYGPNNAVIALSGDVTPAQARAAIERYFGDIPPGPSVDSWRDLIPTRAHDTREDQYDDVPAIMVDRVWVAPARRSRESALLDLAAQILGGSHNSRLYAQLVNTRRIAIDASATNQPLELAGMFEVTVRLDPGQDVRLADQALDRVVQEFVVHGPRGDELARAKASISARIIRRLESNPAVAHAMAEGELMAGDPAFLQTYLAWIDAATAQDVQAAAARWLATGSHQVDVLPRVPRAAAASGVDRRSGPPAVPAVFPHLRFPPVEQATLSNGARLIVAQRRTIPDVQISVQFNAGYAADPRSRLGTASFVSDMLLEGTGARDARAIAADAERLGAQLRSDANLDTSTITLWALGNQLEASVGLLADVVTNARFPAEAVERLRARRLAGLAQERSSPSSIVDHVLPPLLYGEDHPYGVPFTGTGNEAATRAISRDDLIHFHDQWLRPDNAAIIVVGDTSLAEIRPIVERALRGWRAPSTPLPATNIPTPAAHHAPRLVIVDRPGAPQSLIQGGLVGPRANAPNDVALSAANEVFAGGEPSARVNANLREDKHWTYGGGGRLIDARGPRPYFLAVSVQTDRTGAALRELVRELSDLNGARPITQAELDLVVTNNVRRLPGALQNQSAVRAALMASVDHGRALDYAAHLPELYAALRLGDVRAAARELLDPDAMVWVIVGDRAAIEPQLAGLNIAPIEHYDADGRPTG